MKLLTVLLFAFILTSCRTEDENNLKQREKNTDRLKDYQQYAFKRMIQADFDDQGFNLADSFHLWSWDNFGKDFKNNRISRTYSDGYYHYLFWTHFKDTAIIYAEDSIPAVQLLNDTLFDANGDGAKDFVATYNPGNGKCPPDFTVLFIMDTTRRKFRKIEIVERILYAKFHPANKTITSKIICGVYTEYYKFKWNENFGIDTVYSTVRRV